MKVRFTLPALVDLDALAGYVSARSPQGARRIKHRLEVAVRSLAEHPNIGRKTDDPSVRRLTMSPYPYLIFYQIGDDEIVILAIRHAARDPGSMPGGDREESP